MINLLFVWLVIFAILTGWGLALVAWLRRFGFVGGLGLFATMWLGYAGLLCFLQLVSLVAPISLPVLVISAVPAVVGFGIGRRVVLGRLFAQRARPRVVATRAIVVLLASVVTAYAAWDLVRLYDTGLYHLQAVKWSAHYPAVEGLANLHMRFGYNNSVHLFGAYTDAFWEGEAAHIANGFLLAAVLGQWFVEILGARTPRGRVRQIFCLATLPFLLAKLWTLEVASLSTDLPLAVFAFVIVLELISLPVDSSRGPSLGLAVMLSLAAVATTTKLGGLPLLLVVGVICVRAAWNVPRRSQIVLFGLPFLIIVGWLVRGVILSGWLIYPVFGHLPVAWAVPQSVASVDFQNIQSWARVFGKPPEEVFGHGFWHWFSPWLENFRGTRELILAVVSAALIAWRMANTPRPFAVRRIGQWSAVSVCVIGLLQWFWGAPDLRYGGFWFWLLPATLLAPMLAGSMRDVATSSIAFILSLAFCVWGGGFAFHQVAKLPKLWGRPPYPQAVQVRRDVIAPGVDVLVPTETDQCFDAPLPCTPTPGSPVPRDPGDMGAGYLQVHP